MNDEKYKKFALKNFYQTEIIFFLFINLFILLLLLLFFKEIRNS
jgi:hypothetical protein